MGTVLHGAAPGADSRQSRCPAAIITGAHTRKYSRWPETARVVRHIMMSDASFRSST